MPDLNRTSIDDRFADALDALVLGMPRREGGDDSLASLATAIQGIGAGFPTGSVETTSPRLDRATKSRIWADLMRERGGARAQPTIRQDPGASGSTLSLNPWNAKPASSQPKRPRPSSGVLRFVPAAQPTSTFLLVLAVVVLVGATFASLSPNGGQGVFPTVLATENPAQLALANAEASPDADECNLGTPGIEQSSATVSLPERMYRMRSHGVPDLNTIHVTRAWEALSACGGLSHEGNRLPLALVTDRYAADFGDAIEEERPLLTSWIVSEEEAAAILGWSPASWELDALLETYNAVLAEHPGFEGDGLALDVDLGQVRYLADDRIAIYSSLYWLAETGLVEPGRDIADGAVVQVHIFAQEEGEWRYDETLRLCIGPCEGFEETGPEQLQLLMATADAEDLQWMTPLTDDSCTGPGLEPALDPPASPAVETDPADYVPFAAADPADQIAAATTYLRLTSGCEPTDAQPIFDEDEIAILGVPGEPGTTQSQVDTAMAISGALGYADPVEIAIAGGEDVQRVDQDGNEYTQNMIVLLPDDIVQLPDGRLGGMLRYRVIPDFAADASVGDMTNALFFIFSKDTGAWVIDEAFALCFGNCQEFWAREPAPASTPQASPVAGNQFPRPVTAEQSKVDARPREQIRTLQR